MASAYETAVLADSPKALWMLNELSGPTAADASGNGNTGTYGTGQTLGAPSIIPGDPGDTSITCTNTASNGLTFTSGTPPASSTAAWALEACIKTGTLPTPSHWEVIVMNGSDITGSGLGYGLGVGGSGDVAGSSLVVLLNGVAWSPNAYTLASATKYHVVVVYASAAGGTLTWYVNGANVATQTAVGSPGTPNAPGGYAACVGNDPGAASSGVSGRDWSGSIQAAAIYGANLTSTRVTAHYNAYITPPAFTSFAPLAGWQSVLNTLAGTSNLGENAAANRYAGTSNLGLLAALNAKAGTSNLGLDAVCNKIAGTTGLSALGALNVKAGL
jgi:hypothetical protein